MFPTIKEQEELVAKKLATKRISPDGKLALYKYSRKVMYDQIWNDRTMECRGHVYDIATGAIVQAAPRKCFNYLENGWWKDAPLNTIVRVEKKYNGFLANATIHNGELLVTTTGSFDSDFQKIAKQMIEKHLSQPGNVGLIDRKFTTSFEICHPSDPHIITEKEGVYLLCYRYKDNGQVIHRVTDFHLYMTLQEILDRVKLFDNIEGVMLSGYNGQVCKLKSPIYVAKKKLMRMGAFAIEKMYVNRQIVKDQIDSRFWCLVDFIVDTIDIDQWHKLTDQDRRGIIDLYLHNKGYSIE